MKLPLICCLIIAIGLLALAMLHSWGWVGYLISSAGDQPASSSNFSIENKNILWINLGDETSTETNKYESDGSGARVVFEKAGVVIGAEAAAPEQIYIWNNDGNSNRAKGTFFTYDSSLSLLVTANSNRTNGINKYPVVVNEYGDRREVIFNTIKAVEFKNNDWLLILPLELGPMTVTTGSAPEYRQTLSRCSYWVWINAKTDNPPIASIAYGYSGGGIEDKAEKQQTSNIVWMGKFPIFT